METLQIKVKIVLERNFDNKEQISFVVYGTLEELEKYMEIENILNEIKGELKWQK